MKTQSSDSDSDYFTYDAINSLCSMDEFENMVTYNENVEIFLVPFKINLDGKHPFNSIMLINERSEQLNFATLYNSILKIDTKETLFSSINCYLYSMFVTFTNNTNNTNKPLSFDEFVNTIDFKGFYYYQDKAYIFIDLTKVSINIGLVNKDDIYWFTLIDEIINKKNVCNIEINEAVREFFINNTEFIFFKDENQKQIEIPSVVYSGTHDKSLYFNYIFGNTPSDNNSILGSGYYFTDFDNAIRQGGWSPDYNVQYKYGELVTENDKGKYIKGGIIRYALFLGLNLIKLNYPNDTIDESEIKKNRLSINNPTNDYEYEKMTMRISDHDGLWKEKYDSVFLGKLELDNGELLKNTPIYLCKDYYNHVPLSWHYINKRLLGEEFVENKNYQII